jgi:hypothetical protein
MTAVLRVELDPLHVRQVLQEWCERRVRRGVVSAIDDEAWDRNLVQAVSTAVVIEPVRSPDSTSMVVLSRRMLTYTLCTMWMFLKP